MKTVSVAKETLLVNIKSNLERHLANYKEAIEGYKKKSLEKLEKFYSEAQEKFKKGEAAHFQALPLPVSYEKEYRTVICMLEFSVDDIIHLTYEEFRAYVEDQWVWREKFDTLNSTYLAHS